MSTQENIAETAEPFEIAGLRVEPALRRVTDGRRTVQLEPKVMRVLACLVARAGEVVSRAELMDVVWGDAHVGEDPLNRAISELRKLFADEPRSPRVIETIPKRGYRLIAEVRPAATPGEEGTAALPGRAFATRAAVAAAVLLAAIGVVVLAPDDDTTPPGDTVAPPVRIVPITSYPGREYAPALSPDGQRVAFGWVGPEGESLDVYVKQRNTEEPLRLTSTPASEWHPAWSADGASVAFLRSRDGGCEVAAVPSIGGPERKLYECTGALVGFDLSPDSTQLAVSDQETPGETYRIFLVSLESGERRPLSDPPRGQADLVPRFSPDGRRVAFKRRLRAAASEIFLTDFASGATRRLTADGSDVGGLDWAADGRSLVYSSNQNGVFSLWRVPVAGGEPAWVGYENAYTVSIVAGGLAYERRSRQISIWRTALPPEGGLGERWIASTRLELEPRYSPDGSRVAFISQRSGSFELWVAGAEGGGHPAQLTFFHQPGPAWQPSLEHPRWSPDGTEIAFSRQDGERFAIFAVASGGGLPRRLRGAEGDDRAPCWPDDGRFVYFVSDRSGENRVWRMDRDGANAVELESSRATPALACPGDGALYYSGADDRRLRRLEPGGGGEEILDVTVESTDWTATRDGVYRFAKDAGRAVLVFHGFASGEDEWRLPLLGYDPAAGVTSATGGLAVSPDGRWALSARVEGNESDVVLVEGFR